MKKLPFLILLLILFDSCSSTFYSYRRREKDNTITINSEIGNFNAVYQDRKQTQTLQISAVPNHKNSYTVTLPSPYRKGKITITKENYNPVEIRIHRSMRTRALIFDLIMAIPTCGLSVMVDPFKNTFYRVSKKDKLQKITLKYTNVYMQNEFVKIEKSNNPSDFEKYIEKFPYSIYVNHSISKRDSLEVHKAIGLRSEKQIEQFISNRPNSKYLSLAEKERRILEKSRLAFETISSSKQPNDFKVFLNNFPNSLEAPSAKNLFYITSTDSIIGDDNIEKKWQFLASEKKHIESISDEKGIVLYEKLKKNIASNYQIKLSKTNSPSEIQLIKKNLSDNISNLNSKDKQLFQEIIQESNNRYVKEVIDIINSHKLMDLKSLCEFYSEIRPNTPANNLDAIKSSFDNYCKNLYLEEVSKKTLSVDLVSKYRSEFISNFPEFSEGPTHVELKKGINHLCASEMIKSQSNYELQNAKYTQFTSKFKSDLNLKSVFQEIYSIVRNSPETPNVTLHKELCPVADVVSTFNSFFKNELKTDNVKTIIKRKNSEELSIEILSEKQKLINISLINNSTDKIECFDKSGRNLISEILGFYSEMVNICMQHYQYESALKLIDMTLTKIDNESIEAFNQNFLEEINQKKIACQRALINQADFIKSRKEIKIKKKRPCVGGKKVLKLAEFWESPEKKTNPYDNFDFTESYFKALMTDNEFIAFANCNNGKITNYSLHTNNPDIISLSSNPWAQLIFGYQQQDLNFSGIEHTHKCSACENWNENQRYNHICQRCNGEQSISCSAVHKCPICNGTGMVESEISQSTEDEQNALIALKKMIDKWVREHSDYKLTESLQNILE